MTEQGWIPVALSASIEAGTSAGAVIDGAEVVVWRDNKNAAHVWEDRCPHRGMRMSFGFVRGDHIACLYHGWAYDTAGQCQYIPAHPDLEVPKTIKIPTYSTVEKNGIIWTALTEGADIAGVPDVAADATPVRSLYVDCTPATALAALKTTSLPQPSGPAIPAALDAVLHNCWRLTAGNTEVLIACQSIGNNRTGLHIVLLGATAHTAALRAPLARWAEQLRHALENSATPAMAEVA
ncbi:Rieske (2Fe-2S) protein [Ciceribacter sp. L1K22]|uniref:Rieske (2Fe-2S) protein n=1 Tax=Ciceribacter sp. L1K22 TaxID=2820275 RepID=UPI001ABE57F7|nr:Rieske (2Fe-2S) protein [Ciceribacter sp. L1K22]MBO3762174.1 Rieske (2Fe-2S) protein [Ciceribacter sp. L1K22]